jgi:hypothetical protein
MWPILCVYALMKRRTNNALSQSCVARRTIAAQPRLAALGEAPQARKSLGGVAPSECRLRPGATEVPDALRPRVQVLEVAIERSVC